MTNKKGKGNNKARARATTRTGQGQQKKQIPCGNDKQKSEGNNKDKGKSNRRSRFPAGMTNEKARLGLGDVRYPAATIQKEPIGSGRSGSG
jgi:hypothetical protein